MYNFKVTTNRDTDKYIYNGTILQIFIDYIIYHIYIIKSV